MVKLIWTDQAIEDLESIADYIAESSELYAKRTVQKLYQRTVILKQFPKAGRVVPEKSDDHIRELIEGSYRIIYEIISEREIDILTIHHSARELLV